jgi:CAAX protease family protein
MTAAVASPARHSLRSAIAGHPVAAFIVIAFSTTWVLTLLTAVSLVFGLLGLFGPAFAAVMVTRAEGTWPELRARITGWRSPARWYAIAFLTPFLVAAAARVALAIAGAAPIGFGSISAIEGVIFVLVIGEEIGWRGFLQPRLRTRLGIGAAGIAVGVLWTLWHVVLYLVPEVRVVDFAVFAWWVIPMAVVIGAIAEGAGFSVLVATVMHGAANIAAPIVLPDVDRTWTLIVTGAIYGVIAVGIVVWSHHVRPARMPKSDSREQVD